jgi:hypothetical protein
MTIQRRVVLVEIDSTEGRWSRSELESLLLARIPELRPVVFGEIAEGEVDAAFRKLRQLARETENNASYGDREHSAHKALSFFRDMWPTRYWAWFEIGADHPRRSRLLGDPG